MALNPLKSHITAEKAAWAPYFSVGAFNASTISTQSLNASSINASSIQAYSVSSVLLDAEEINTSTISTIAIDLDGQYLTASATELLLNGIPIAVTSNLSSLADWSLDPAISTVYMQGNDIRGAGLISSATVIANSAAFGQLFAYNSFFLSSYNSTVSSLVENAELGIFSTLQAGDGNVSSLVAQNYISTPDLEVSSINGHTFGENTATISSLISNNISSVFGDFNVTLTSSLQFNPGFNLGGVNLGLGNLFGNLGGAALGGLGVLVGGAALGTGIAALAQGRQTKTIGNSTFELINGTTQLQVSTLGETVSSIFRFVSSVDVNTPGEEFFTSTIIPSGTACIRSVSDPLNTVSTPNSTIQYFGQWVSLDEVVPPSSTISTFNDLRASSIEVSTISFYNDTQFRAGSSFGGNPGVSTLELFWPGAAPPLDATLRVGDLILSGSDVGGLNYSKDVLIANQNAGNRLLVYGAGGVGPSTIAFTSDIPAPAPVVSTFPDLHTGTLEASTINIGTNGAINIIEDGGIYLGISGGNNGSLSAGTDPSLILDGASSEVSVPNVNVDKLGGKNFTTIDLGADINALGLQRIYGATEMQASTFSASTIVVEDRVIINPSTIYSGIWMNFDPGAVPGLYMGLSTGLLTNNYAALAAGEQTPYNEANSRGLTLYQTEDAEVSYQYGDLNVGRIIVAGNTTNYGANPYGYMTGDTGGNLTLHAASVNFSTATAVAANTLKGNGVQASTLSFLGPSTVILSTSATAGVRAQPVGRLMLGGNDLDLAEQDLWCQQVRLGAGTAGGSAQTEVVWYAPDGSTRGLGLGSADLTIRLQSTINSGNNNGYLLDTLINRPFFSTINAGTSTALVAQFPSTTLGNFGFSTLAVVPPLTYIAAVYDSTSQLVAAANTSTPLVWNTAALNLGGFTVGTSTIQVPVAGVYEHSASIQFATTSGGTNEAEFWLTKNGNAVPQTNSRVAIVNNGDTIGTISIFDTAAAGDKYGWMIWSSDANMSAAAVAAGATPAIPSIIFNTKRIG